MKVPSAMNTCTRLLILSATTMSSYGPMAILRGILEQQRHHTHSTNALVRGMGLALDF
jgi:hypothetical protein